MPSQCRGRSMLETMDVNGLVSYTRGQLEQLARELFRARVDFDSEKLPIDVEFLLETVENVRLGQPLPRLMSKYSVEGCVCNRRMAKEIVVHVDRDIADGPDDARYSAVIAEELAHIIAHRVFLYEIKSIEDFAEVQRCPELT